MVTPIVFTVTILNDNVISEEDVKQKILNISSHSTAREIVEFNAVGTYVVQHPVLFYVYINNTLDVCLCGLMPTQHSSVVNICVGPSISPCICNDSGCRVS